VKLWKLEGENWIIETTDYITFETTSIQLIADDGAYRMITICVDGSSNDSLLPNVTIKAQLLFGGAVFAHRSIVDLDLQGETISTIRIMGVSLMYSNTTAEIYKSGTVALAQVPKPNMWDNYLSLTKITKVSGNASMNASTGAFGFIKPNDYPDFEMLNFINFDQTGVLTSFEYDVVPKHSFIVLFIANVAETTGSQQSGRWTISHSLEYLTNNQWIEKKTPRGSKELYEEALSAVKLIPQFHENPFHLSDILGVAKKIANTVLKYGPGVMDFAKKVSNA